MFELDLSLRKEYVSEKKRKLEAECEDDARKRREITDERICAAHASADPKHSSFKHPHAGVLSEFGGIQKYMSVVMCGDGRENITPPGGRSGTNRQ